MSRTIAERRARFRALHAEGCFLLPNPWDAGSARLMQHLGFEAIASTSSGHAWTRGLADYAVTRDQVLDHLAVLAAAVDIPVNADFETGFSATPEGLAENVRLAVATGIAGLSIEDRDVAAIDSLYPAEMAVERIRAARAAIDGTGEDVLLVGRTEGLLTGGTVSDAIDRLVALADAGADCLYAPGIGMPGRGTIDDIAVMVRAVAPKPVNVLVVGSGIAMGALADAGVRRISVGGALARIAWGAAVSAAERLREGDLAALDGALPGRDLDAIFGDAG
ncbi:isocitrate lyase/PEP mutase family protein [Flavisphingomonas formosensis]|uniref:isocitrate lyase/PEP mutase family protein n=1 Tax=Flavisphingomonas formosensis TaxID=861534 RepID=UPI0012F71DFE|nr:isocitrate lyase/phosphoenolpyruvate mutase family protein [Sphingomonas formosensis]